MRTPAEPYSESRFEEILLPDDKPPGRVTYFEQPFGEYALEGRILFNQAGDTPWVISIHGARGGFTKANPISFSLQERGYSQLGMNMSGHSKAGVLEPEQTTLGNNVREVEAFFDYLDDTRQRMVIAYSLGGTPALKLLQNHADEISKLVLFYPGIYDKDAYDKPFGPAFRDVISKPFSYRDNDTIELLKAFKGDLLLIKGEYDGLDPEAHGKPAGTSAGEVTIDGQTYYSPIPKEVIDTVYQAVPEGRRKLIEIPKCDHSVILWMRNHPTEADQLLDQIDTFLSQ